MLDTTGIRTEEDIMELVREIAYKRNNQAYFILGRFLLGVSNSDDYERDRIANLFLIAFRNNEEINLRLKIVWILGEIGSPQSVIPLMNMIEEESSCLRNNIIEALGLIGDPRAVGFLVNYLEREKNKNLITTIYLIKALANIGDPQAIEVLSAIRDNKKHKPRCLMICLNQALKKLNEKSKVN